MAGDAKREDLAVADQKQKHDFDFEITCKRFKNWLSTKPFPTFPNAVLTAFFGFSTSTYLSLCCHSIIRKLCIDCHIPPPSPQSKFLLHCGGYKPLVESFLAKGPDQMGYNIALMRACNTSISFVMKNIRGKEDLQTVMVAGFGYGIVVSLVNGVRGLEVMTIGATCAILNVGRH